MNYNGDWKQSETGEEIRISIFMNTDDYLMEWEKEETGYNKEERIQILRSRDIDKSSHIPFSSRFGVATINNIDSNSIQINRELFKRQNNHVKYNI